MLLAPSPVPVRAPAHAWGQQLRSQATERYAGSARRWALSVLLSGCDPLAAHLGVLTGRAVGGLPEVELLRWRCSHFGMVLLNE